VKDRRGEDWDFELNPFFHPLSFFFTFFILFHSNRKEKVTRIRMEEVVVNVMVLSHQRHSQWAPVVEEMEEATLPEI
jgi:hypothetical protein